MSHATVASEILRRISAGELPAVADFIVVPAKTGGGTCRGCGLALSAGEFRCVIDCVTANLEPFPMHVGCFLVWSEACMRTAEHEDRALTPGGPTGTSEITGVPGAWETLKETMFCQTRLEMLGNRMRGASQFADAVSHMRKSQSAKARAACESARRESRLAHEAYDEHVRDHGC